MTEIAKVIESVDRRVLADRMTAMGTRFQLKREDVAPHTILWNSLALPSRVTELPDNPKSGDVVRFVADSTNDIVWWLMYDGEAEGSYKWLPLQATPLFEEVTANDSTSSATYTALANAGPTITVPLAGDYYVTIGSRTHSGNQNVSHYHSYDIGSTAASDNDAIDPFAGPTTAVSYASRYEERTRKKTITAASTALTSKYKSGGGTNYWINRTMRLVPIRVG